MNSDSSSIDREGRPLDRTEPTLPLATKEQEEEQRRLEAAGLEPTSGREWALCLSGGGYRAMLFHVGSILRLNELGYLSKLDRVSSVSGGSITAGALAAAWPRITWDGGHATNLAEVFVKPIRKMAGKTVDYSSIARGVFWTGTIAQRVADAYREHLFPTQTLQDLPERPRFVINATNLGTGVLWRFSKPYMGDWRIGRIPNPRLSLAEAVAASSAFPPFLSPLRLKLDPAQFTLREGTDVDDPKFRAQVFLTDGGVYDNLGLETASGYRNLLVSDGGGDYEVEESPARNWPFQLIRVTNTIDRQVRALRRRHLIASYTAPVNSRGHHGGAFWSIRTDIAEYGLSDALRARYATALELAGVKTRLGRLPDRIQERLVNWGYAITDAAVRRYVQDEPPPPKFPYEGEIG